MLVTNKLRLYLTSVLNTLIISILPRKLKVGHPHPSSDYPSFKDIDLLYSELEGTARYAGLLLDPVEGFGQGFFLTLWAKKYPLYADFGPKQP